MRHHRVGVLAHDRAFTFLFCTSDGTLMPVNLSIGEQVFNRATVFRPESLVLSGIQAAHRLGNKPAQEIGSVTLAPAGTGIGRDDTVDIKP